MSSTNLSLLAKFCENLTRLHRVPPLIVTTGIVSGWQQHIAEKNRIIRHCVILLMILCCNPSCRPVSRVESVFQINLRFLSSDPLKLLFINSIIFIYATLISTQHSVNIKWDPCHFAPFNQSKKYKTFVSPIRSSDPTRSQSSNCNNATWKHCSFLFCFIKISMDLMANIEMRPVSEISFLILSKIGNLDRQHRVLREGCLNLKTPEVSVRT